MKRYISPMTRTDKLCALFLVAAFLAPNFAVLALDQAAYRAAEAADAGKPTAITITAPEIDFTPLVEAVEEARQAAEYDLYDETIPLDRDLQAVLREACEENGVAVCDALGVIEVESGFDPEASNGVCVGLMQTNEKYASKFKDATGYSIYTPEGNIRGGVWYLGTLLEKYKGDIQAALCAYNAGHDTGARGYAKAVLASSEQWGCG